MKQITHETRAAQLVAANIDRQKRLHGTKYETIAKVINVSKGTLSSRMKHPETFTLFEIFTLARFFKVDVSEIIGG